MLIHVKLLPGNMLQSKLNMLRKERGIQFFLQGLSWADAGGPARGWAGPAQLVKFSEDGPRPDPAHHIFKYSRPGPARHMAARPMRHGLYMDWPDNCVGRPMCCPVRKGACAYATCTAFFFCFFPVWIPWDSCFRPVNLTVTGRPMCCPGLKGACAYAKFIAGFSLFVPSLDSVGQLLSARGFDGPAHVLSRTKGCMCICYVYCWFFVVWSPSGFRGTAAFGP